MEVTYHEDESGTVSVHGVSQEEIAEWSKLIGKPTERIYTRPPFDVLKFTIGKVEIKLFSRDIEP